MRLKNRIILLTVLVCIVSVISMAIINYNVSIKRLEVEVNEKVQLEAESISKDIDKWMALQKDNLYGIIEDLLIGQNFEKSYVENYLAKAIKRNPGNSYYMTFLDGTYFSGTHWKPDSTYDASTQHWYYGAINEGNYFVSAPYIDEQTKDMVVTISKSFRAKDTMGVIATNIKIEHLIDLASSVKTSEGAYTFLVDNNNNILTHPNDSFKPKDGEYHELSSILDGKLSELSTKENLNLSNRKIKDYDGVERFFFFGDVQESGWKVVIAIPTSNVLGIIKKVMLLTLMATAIVLAGTIIISSFIANSILSPVKDLNYLMEKIADFDLTDDVLYNKLIKNKTEIGEMGQSLSQMRENLNSVLSTTVNSSKMLLESSEMIDRNTKESAIMIDEVSKATEDLATGAVEQAQETSNGFEKLNALSEGFKYIIRGCQVLEKHAEDTLKAHSKNMEIISSLKENRNSDMSSNISDDLDKSIKAFEEISHSIDDQFKLIKRLVQTIDNANVYKEEAVSAIESIASIAEESSAATEEVSASMEEQSASMTELASMSGGLKELAEKLGKEIERFKID